MCVSLSVVTPYNVVLWFLLLLLLCLDSTITSWVPSRRYHNRNKHVPMTFFSNKATTRSVSLSCVVNEDDDDNNHYRNKTNQSIVQHQHQHQYQFSYNYYTKQRQQLRRDFLKTIGSTTKTTFVVTNVIMTLSKTNHPLQMNTQGTIAQAATIIVDDVSNDREDENNQSTTKANRKRNRNKRKSVPTTDSDVTTTSDDETTNESNNNSGTNRTTTTTSNNNNNNKRFQQFSTTEQCLLNVLPISTKKIGPFRELQYSIESLCNDLVPKSNNKRNLLLTTPPTTTGTTATSITTTAAAATNTATTINSNNNNNTGSSNNSAVFEKIRNDTITIIIDIDRNKRNQLIPIFNPDDETIVQIEKNERYEVLIGILREQLQQIIVYTTRTIVQFQQQQQQQQQQQSINEQSQYNVVSNNYIINNNNNNNQQQQTTISFLLQLQKQALITLSMIGELLVVPNYPYNVPMDGKYSYLPRLLGRAKVTFTIRRPPQKQRNGLLFMNSLWNDNQQQQQQNDFDASQIDIAGPTSSSQKKKVDEKKKNLNNNGYILGNITIIADGYIAPLTAGNFIDLCERNFYTGLPVRFVKKRLGGISTSTSATTSNTVDDNDGDLSWLSSPSSSSSLSSFIGTTTSTDTVLVPNVPIMGSYNEGFYDPLTGKLRRVPFESFHRSIEKKNGFANLLLSTGTSSSSSSTPQQQPFEITYLPLVDPLLPIPQQQQQKTFGKTKPLVSFTVPGIVGMNHPDRNVHGGSSEFFCLLKQEEESNDIIDSSFTTAISSTLNAFTNSNPTNSTSNDNNNNNNKRIRTMKNYNQNMNLFSSSTASSSYNSYQYGQLFDGEYTPFGYIIDGYENVYQQIQPNDIIERTIVDEWGMDHYLIKIRKSSFTEVVQGGSTTNGGTSGNNNDSSNNNDE